MVRLALDRVGTLGPDVEAKVVARIDPEVLTRIQTATRVEWIPATDQVALNDALRAELSVDAYLEFWRATGLAAAKDSIFSQIAQGAMRLFGVSPVAIYKVLPRANKHVTRNVGEYRIEPDPEGRFVRVHFEEVARELLESDAWMLSARATLMTPLQLLDRDGEVEVEVEDPDARHFTWIIRWR